MGIKTKRADRSDGQKADIKNLLIKSVQGKTSTALSVIASRRRMTQAALLRLALIEISRGSNDVLIQRAHSLLTKGDQ